MLAFLLSSLWAAPALAAPSATLELAAWVRSNTDLPVSQIAITGPDNVYSLEQLGPRLPTGEVLALVRTEAVNPDWGDTHQFQSWDAHMLMDCEGGRVRVLRSASYPERDRQGPAKSDERSDVWFTPEAKTPAAILLAAACDPGFHWPLRADPAAEPPKATPLAGPSYLQKASAVSPAVKPGAPVSAKTMVQGTQAPVVVAEPRARPRPAATAPPTEPGLTQAAYVTSSAPSASIERADVQIQHIRFTPTPVLRSPAATPPQASGPPPRKVLATAVAATRICKRLADESRDWFMRRVEVALRRSEPPRPDAHAFRQAAL